MLRPVGFSPAASPAPAMFQAEEVVGPLRVVAAPVQSTVALRLRRLEPERVVAAATATNHALALEPGQQVPMSARVTHRVSYLKEGVVPSRATFTPAAVSHSGAGEDLAPATGAVYVHHRAENIRERMTSVLGRATQAQTEHSAATDWPGAVRVGVFVDHSIGVIYLRRYASANNSSAELTGGSLRTPFCVFVGEDSRTAYVHPRYTAGVVVAPHGGKAEVEPYTHEAQVHHWNTVEVH